MAAENINHKGFQRRLDVIASILQDYGLESTSVTPVEYEETCPYAYNNFIYKVHLSSPIGPNTFESRNTRPGVSAPLVPVTSNAVILRLSNPLARGLNNAHRVENEVAAQQLFRQQLSANNPEWAHLVPAVFAWAPCRYSEVPDEAGFGWTICEFMPGANLDIQFAEMNLAEKLTVVQQVADIFAAIQQTHLPGKLTMGHLGGLTFDSAGQVVGGQMSILPAGPWTDYTDMWVQRLAQQVDDADKSSALKGWHEAGVRGRIDELITSDKIGKLVKEIDTTQRTLVHGDLTMNNMLFDRNTQKVTALLDFDFSWISHPGHEFITGLWDLGGGLRLDDQKLRDAVLTGKFDNLNDKSVPSENKISWEVAKAWDSALLRRGVARPASITGMIQLERLMKLEDMLCPGQLGNEMRIERLKRQSPTKLSETIRAATDRLTAFLDELDGLCA